MSWEASEEGARLEDRLSATASLSSAATLSGQRCLCYVIFREALNPGLTDVGTIPI